MRLTLIVFQIGLLALFAVHGALASAEDGAACPLPHAAAQSCEDQGG